jgi:hypothetical protein
MSSTGATPTALFLNCENISFLGLSNCSVAFWLLFFEFATAMANDSPLRKSYRSNYIYNSHLRKVSFVVKKNVDQKQQQKIKRNSDQPAIYFESK